MSTAFLYNNAPAAPVRRTKDVWFIVVRHDWRNGNQFWDENAKAFQRNIDHATRFTFPVAASVARGVGGAVDVLREVEV